MGLLMGELVSHGPLGTMGLILLPRDTCTQDNNDTREPVSILSHDSILVYSPLEQLVINQEELLASFS